MSTYRLIPSIDQLLAREGVRTLVARFGHDAVVDALRSATAQFRSTVAVTPESSLDPDAIAASLEADAVARVEASFRPSLRRVINATGVIVHTNLGRAPLADAAAERVAEIARGYVNLEYDLHRGARGARDAHPEPLLTALTGAEAAVVVNNNAAATMLALAALAAGREVIVSRGELVEIGGGFRVPDVMAQSGAVLREVGTTNKTRTADYASAISDRTAAILRVHRSNFRLEGFTSQPSIADLAALTRKFNLPLIEDLGSGNLAGELMIAGAARLDEPSVQASIKGGADLVLFSGDKLLGGPQAGILAGSRALIDRIRRHPLMRAVRVDKMVYAALEATLLEYATGRALDTVPVLRFISAPVDAVDRRARTLVAALGELADLLAPAGQVSVRARLHLDVIDGLSAIGGGSAPGETIPTRLVALQVDGMGADTLAARLRAGDPPIIARIESDRVVLDLRTVPEQEDALLAEYILKAASA